MKLQGIGLFRECPLSNYIKEETMYFNVISFFNMREKGREIHVE